MLQHQDRQASECDSSPEYIAQQVRTKELVQVEDCPQRAKPETGSADYQRAPLKAIYFRGSLIRHLQHQRCSPCFSSGCTSPSLSRLSGGTSAIVPRWLSCSARM